MMVRVNVGQACAAAWLLACAYLLISQQIFPRGVLPGIAINW